MTSGVRPIAHSTPKPGPLCLLLALGIAFLRGSLGVAHANDQFADRIVKEGISWSENGDNRNATMESGEPSHFSGGTGRSLWWTWTSPEPGIVSLDTFPSSNYSAVAV